MAEETSYNLIVKVTVSPMMYLQTSNRFSEAVSKSLREGTEALRDAADKVGLHVIDSQHYYEAKES